VHTVFGAAPAALATAAARLAKAMMAARRKIPVRWLRCSIRQVFHKRRCR
jgi:hypothetical protein